MADLFPTFSADLVDDLFPADLDEDFLVAFDGTLEEGDFWGLVDFPFAFLLHELLEYIATACFGVYRVFPSEDAVLWFLPFHLALADKMLARLEDLRLLLDTDDDTDSSLSVPSTPATRVDFRLVLGLERWTDSELMLLLVYYGLKCNQLLKNKNEQVGVVWADNQSWEWQMKAHAVSKNALARRMITGL